MLGRLSAAPRAGEEEAAAHPAAVQAKCRLVNESSAMVKILSESRGRELEHEAVFAEGS